MKLPIFYLPPIDWFRQYLADESAELDFGETYQKQSPRNHCLIDSPQGALKLTVPVSLPNPRCLTRDVRISEHGDWRHKHWHAIETTYFNSPFFEYLQDDFRPLYERHFEFLVDFNTELIEVCRKLLLQDSQPSLFTLHPERSEVYYQVFAHKHGFIPNLSIIDLIFNMGNESVLYLVNNEE